MGSKPAKQTTKTNQSTSSSVGPASFQQPYYDNLYKEAAEAFKISQGTQQFATPTTWQTQANNQLAGMAPTLSAGAAPMRDLATKTASGYFLDPATNPFIRDAAAAAIRPVQERYTNSLIPQVSDAAIASGAYGGARQDLQENDLLAQFTREAGGITSGMYADNYARERQLQQGAGKLFGDANALDMAGIAALSGAGLQQQQWDQVALDEPRARGWAGIPEMLQVLQAGGFNSSKGTSKGTNVTTTEGASNPLASAVQGLVGGAGAGMGVAKGLGVAAPAGATGMAALGTFAPWMLPFAALGGLGGAMG